MKTEPKNQFPCRLFCKPSRPPKWWPRDARGRSEFRSVIDDGWVQGEGKVFRTEGALERAKEVIEDIFYKPRFKIELVGRKTS